MSAANKTRKAGRSRIPDNQKAVKFSTSVPAETADYLRTIDRNAGGAGIEARGARILIDHAVKRKLLIPKA